MRRPAPVRLKPAAERGCFELKTRVEVLTPMFGGGVWIDPREGRTHLKEPDEVTPIRGAAIRGQLRFWWRATHGARCGSIAVMREREDALWGNASLPSSVGLRLEGSRLGAPAPMDVPDSDKDLSYATFPLRPVDSSIPGKLHTIDGHTTLVLTGPAQHEQEVRDALDAWLAFGGLGGRTRRGFGAVASGEALDPEAVLKRLTSGGGEPLAGVSSLYGARLVLGRSGRNKALDALRLGLQRLRAFRQHSDANRMNTWPEPDAIRRITGVGCPRHNKATAFPRGQLGSPIIFHFKEGDDPSDTTLTPEDAERRASPVLIRPYKSGESSYRVMALCLSDPAAEREGYVLREGATRHPVTTRLEPQEADFAPLNGEPDVLKRFLDYFQE